MLDHEAIRKAYPDAVIVDDATGAFKEDGTQINIVQSEVCLLYTSPSPRDS